MNLLEKGQYLGNTFGGFVTNDLSITGSIHRKSESEFHQHQNAYLSILLQGVYVETSTEKSRRIFPSEVLYRPSNYIHKNTFESTSAKCLNIEFHKDWFKKLDIEPVNETLVINQINNFPFLFQIITDFIKYNHISIAEDILLDFISEIIKKPTNHYHSPWLSKLIRIINNETETVHSLKSLSERIYVHPNYMSRVFKAKTGKSIGEYQIEQKLNKATKELLQHTSNIVEIANSNGFFDEAHFIRTFKSKYGITPHQFRLVIKS